MKEPKTNRPKLPPSSGFSRRWQIVSVLALAAGGLFWLYDPAGQDPASGSASPQASNRATARDADAASAAVKRLAGLAERGKNTIPIPGATPDGLPVPAAVPDRTLMGSGWSTDPEPELADFAAWTKEYLATPEKNRASLEEKGIKMAKARRGALSKQIASDPRRALGNSIPLDIRTQLPPTIEGLLEDRVGGFGQLAIFYGLANEGEPAIAPVDRATINGTSYVAHRYGSRSLVPYVNEASLHGIAINGDMAVLDSPVRMLEKGERIDGKTVNSSCPISGKTVAQTATGAVTEAETMFQLGGSFFEVCEPAHVNNVETSIVSMEKNGENIATAINEEGLHVLCFPKPMGSGDSGVSGSTGYFNRPPASLTHGGKSILFMRVQPTDKPYPTDVTQSYLENLVWEPTVGMDAWMKRISYNKTWITTAHVTPVMNLGGNSAYYTGGGYNWGRWMDDAKAAAAAQGYNLANYSTFVVAHANYGQFGAAAWGGGGGIWCNGVFDHRIMVHEYGHVFWLPHANAWLTSDSNPMSVTRQHVEYGDHNDIMGGGWLASGNTSYNAYYKNLCGWLPDAAVQNVTKTGTYRVYQDDGATALNRTLALKVGRDGEYNYWLSICGLPLNLSNFNNGVAVRAVSSWRQSDTHLVDINEPSDTYVDDAPLLVGNTWHDAAADLSIKTVAVGGTNPNRYADVEITIGSTNTSAYRPLVHGGVYRLRNRYYGTYLHVPGNSSASGVDLQAAAASNDNSQNWMAWRNADGSYFLNHLGTDKWLTVENNSTADGGKIWQYNGIGDDSQKWHVSQNPEGYIHLFHKESGGKLMEMDEFNQTIRQRYLRYWANQEWFPEIVAISPGTYRVLSRNLQGQSLEIQGGGGANGTVARNALYGGFSNQKWNVSDGGSGALRFTPNSDFGQALDVNGSGTVDGTRIQQYGWNASNAQRWNFSRTDGHWLRLSPACAPASSMDAGGLNLVHLWGSHTGYHQQWRFVDAD